MIRDATLEDADAIARIYNHYVENTIVTFEETPISLHQMWSRMEDTIRSLPWLVKDIDGKIVGYAYASKWKGRCAYRYSVESTVYLDPAEVGKGTGSELYSHFLTDLRRRSFHTVMGGIALPNAASVALHEKWGFKKVAHFQEVGWKFGQWIDVGYWQLRL